MEMKLMRTAGLPKQEVIPGNSCITVKMFQLNATDDFFHFVH